MNHQRPASILIGCLALIAVTIVYVGTLVVAAMFRISPP